MVFPYNVHVHCSWENPHKSYMYMYDHNQSTDKGSDDKKAAEKKLIIIIIIIVDHKHYLINACKR